MFNHNQHSCCLMHFKFVVQWTFKCSCIFYCFADGAVHNFEGIFYQWICFSVCYAYSYTTQGHFPTEPPFLGVQRGHSPKKCYTGQ